MPRVTHPDDGRVLACPGCDKAGDVYLRTHPDREYDHDFRCNACGHEFDAPVNRETKTNPVGSEPMVPRTDDGLPSALNDDAKELVRSVRGDSHG